MDMTKFSKFDTKLLVGSLVCQVSDLMNLSKAAYSIALCLLFTCGVQSFALLYIFTNSTNHSVFVCIRAELSLLSSR